VVELLWYPVLLGGGIPVLSAGVRRDLRLRNERRFRNGVVQATYDVNGCEQSSAVVRRGGRSRASRHGLVPAGPAARGEARSPALRPRSRPGCPVGASCGGAAPGALLRTSERCRVWAEPASCVPAQE
jgi:hypothetical protein